MLTYLDNLVDCFGGLWSYRLKKEKGKLHKSKHFEITIAFIHFGFLTLFSWKQYFLTDTIDEISERTVILSSFLISEVLL